MTLSYWWRLIWLALASFFLVHLVIGSAVALAAPIAIRFAAHLQPGSSTRLLFVLRLLPAAFSLLVVAMVFTPSYLLFEPEVAGEQLGVLCIAAALLACLSWCISLGRCLHAFAQSLRYRRRWRCGARIEHLGDGHSAALVIDSNAPFLALAGIVRPTLIASRGLLRALSPTELDAAVRHEQAHRTSHDNLKRMLIRCAPGLFPFVSGFDAIERAWAKHAERAADDRSIGGDHRRALLLADALVRVARSGIQHQSAPFLIQILPEGSELRERVERLLHPSLHVRSSEWRVPFALAASCIALAVLLAQPFALRSAHELLECLVR